MTPVLVFITTGQVLGSHLYQCGIWTRLLLRLYLPQHLSMPGHQQTQHWLQIWSFHDDVIKWRHFPRYWPFVRGIHRSPVNSQHKGQWRVALMFSLICVWINGWVNNGEAGDLRHYRAHYDVTVMFSLFCAIGILSFVQNGCRSHAR